LILDVHTLKFGILKRNIPHSFSICDSNNGNEKSLEKVYATKNLPTPGLLGVDISSFEKVLDCDITPA